MKKTYQFRTVASIVSRSLRCCYGISELSSSQQSELQQRLSSLSLRNSILSMNLLHSVENSEMLHSIATAIKRVADLLDQESQRNGVLQSLMHSEHVGSPDFTLPLMEWCRAAPKASNAIRGLANDIRTRPFREPQFSLETHTNLVGGHLWDLYKETYPGVPFERAPSKAKSRIALPDRWGPGPLFIAICVKAITGETYRTGEAIRKARKSFIKARGYAEEQDS